MDKLEYRRVCARLDSILEELLTGNRMYYIHYENIIFATLDELKNALIARKK